MSKATPAQSSFASGEISPLMYGRVGLEKYANGAKLLRNFLVKPQGAIRRRTGSRMCAPVLEQADSPLIKEFVFSDSDAFLLEFGHLYIRVFKSRLPVLMTDTANKLRSMTVEDDGGLFRAISAVIPGKLIASIANNGSGRMRVTTTASHFFKTGNYVKLSVGTFATPVLDTITRISPTVFDLVNTALGAYSLTGGEKVEGTGVNRGDWVTLFNGAGTLASTLNASWRVHDVSAFDRFTLANSVYAAGTYSAGEAYTFPYHITSPYTRSVVGDLYITQSADKVYITHPNYIPRVLIRNSDEDWDLATYKNVDGPYLPIGSIAPNINPDDPDQGNYVDTLAMDINTYAHTASVDSATNFTDPDDVNDYIEYKMDDQWQLARITAVNVGGNLKKATAQIIDNVLLYLDETTKLQPQYATSGPGAASSYPQGKRQLDPSNHLQLSGGVVKSNFSGTFSQSDVGKYVRYLDTTYKWAKITGVVVGTGGADASIDTPVTFASNNATGQFRIYDHVRTGTVVATVDGRTAFGLFTANDVGRHIRLGFGNRWCWGKISSINSASSIQVAFEVNPPRDPQDASTIASLGYTQRWRLGAWTPSDTVSGIRYPGYPAVSCFHEQRLVFGRTYGEPQTLWFSVPDDYANHEPTDLDGVVLDDSAMTYTIVSGKISALRWLSSGHVLLMSGLGGEWQARAATSVQEPITPKNVSITPQTEFGSSLKCRPARVGATTLFLDRNSRKIRELSYNYEIDAFIARDLTAVGEHMLRTRGGGKYIAFQKDATPMLWAVCNDGTLACMTYDRDQEVVAWHGHALGGSGLAESLAVVPTVVDDFDDLYLVVKRVVGGVTYRHVEYIGADFEGAEADRSGMCFQDCAISGTTAGVASGLYHAEGQVVSVLVGGVSYGEYTVASGKVTITGAPSGALVVGFYMESRVDILPIEGGGIIGTAQTVTKRTNKAGVRLERSLALQWSGDSAATWHDVSLGSTLFTGDKEFVIQQTYGLTGEFSLRARAPYPLTISLIAPRMKTNEEL